MPWSFKNNGECLAIHQGFLNVTNSYEKKAHIFISGLPDKK